MEAEGVKCPNCGGSDIRFLPGGSVRCEHCGSYFADPTRKASGDQPSIHVHVHNTPTEPASPPLPNANDYAPPPQPAPPQPMPVQQPMYAPAPYPPPASGGSGCLKAFVILLVLGVIGFIGLAVLGYFIEQAEMSNPPGSTPSATPGSSGSSSSTSKYKFADVQYAVEAFDDGMLQRILDADSSLANQTGEVNLILPNGQTLSLTGATPLHVAAFYGNERAVYMLLEKGADAGAFAYQVNTMDAAYSPAQLANLTGHYQLEEYLYNEMYGG
ncbi:MAG: hypothetical protein KDB82_18790 [Planctomycetes bacterium]|nr:hypothetical protein [Planctomycetota bacterium]